VPPRDETQSLGLFRRSHCRSCPQSTRCPQTTLWRRQMVLGPGNEFALIVPPSGDVAPQSGWSALFIDRCVSLRPCNAILP
jgi:hypothetical protein